MDIFEAVLWLALNIYHEARSETLIGKKAVAHVTLNRSNNRDLGIKDTVIQPYQFSWVHQLDSSTPENWRAFLECVIIGIEAANEPDFTGGANFYHLNTIKPKWASDPSMRYVGTYGSHLFYTNKPILKIKRDKVKHKKKRILKRRLKWTPSG